MTDVTTIGEVLIDFTPSGVSPQGNPLFEQNPGGAPANVAVCLSRLGCSAAVIGKVGADQFGEFLKNTLDRAGVLTEGLVRTERCGTTMAFVHLSETGDRSFSFYRNPGADLLLEPADLKLELIDKCSILHFGSVSMTGEPSRSATLEAVGYAREKGKIISYDPNLRLNLWSSPEEARNRIMAAVHMADILKVSDDELLFLTGEKDMETGAKTLMTDYNIKLVLVTAGPRGAHAFSSQGSAFHPAYSVKTIDTTGAGDAFIGGFLYQLIKSGREPESLTQNELKEFLAFGNAVGSLVTTRKGGIPAMPDINEVEACMAECGLEG